MIVNLFETSINNSKTIESLTKSFELLLKNGQYVLGKNLETFENNFSKFINSKFTVGVNSGTDALMLSLIASGIKKNDLVITSSFTYFATIEAIYNIGATPYLTDISKTTLQIDFSKIDKKILQSAKAILPVHLFGGYVNVEELKNIKDKYDLIVIEDVAQAFGTNVNGKFAGTFGDCGAFSFYPTKTLGAIGDAGAITTNDEKIYQDLLMLRNHGHIDRDNFKFSGFNSRLDEIQAIFLNERLKNIEKEIIQRNEIARNYISNLSDIKSLTFIECNNSYNYFPILTIDKAERESLIKYLTSKDIQTAIYYKVPLSDLKFDWITKDSNLQNVDNIKNRILCIPIYPSLNIEKQNYVIKSIREFYEA